MSSLLVRDKSPLYEIPSQRTSYPIETKIISTLALLVLGYYVLSFFDAWPSTIRRSLYESFVYLIPSPLIYAMQYGMIRLGRLAPEEAKFTKARYGDMLAKQEALRRMCGQPPIPIALRKISGIPGVGGYISLGNDVGPPGLGNWDNSCYQNSVLQGLASLPAFMEFMESSLELCDKYDVPAATHRALVDFLQKLADSGCRKNVLWTPTVLKSMDSWQQQDAQEYFSKVMDAVEKEANAYAKVMKRSKTTGLECLGAARIHKSQQETSSPLEDPHISQTSQAKEEAAANLLPLGMPNPIDGLTAQILECETCKFTEGLSLTQFNCLTLNMGLRGPSDVEDLLHEYTAPEEVEGVECENCTELAYAETEGSNGKVGKSKETDEMSKQRRKPVLRTKAKQITVGRLPTDLVLHINRSIFDEYGNQQKNTAPVRVPRTLRFLRRWCAPLDENDDHVEALYELKCLVTHFGRHDNGHYVALGKRGKDWYSFNDEIVTKLTEEEVLSRGNGFMLFYESIPFRPHSEAAAERVSIVAEHNENPRSAEEEACQDLTDVLPESSKSDLDSSPRRSSTLTPSSPESPQTPSWPSESSSPVEPPLIGGELHKEIPFLPMRTASDVTSRTEEQHPTDAPIVSAL
ncbi:uncharacterized protein Z518_03163 [Rhinocladiella mackenziei CBS 650.93]|uniref:ubiquitinyl hydrolase 1 n=1 Tax=Rhinocladiella mackenziei CBS 650.93 TaxID=1442369 RepID=A0A0D2G222_9EURO|nr:uncharacterized protein Z518_03163 [Rhinocladiella mackenziei CBS 650.93]KIX08507.1 hypothetical protein Z518_03163 [Rhinocladiella mackenziei CBS 650.93]